jgi:hypothetical protein
MNVDVGDILAIQVATQMRPLVNDETFLALLLGTIGEC